MNKGTSNDNKKTTIILLICVILLFAILIGIILFFTLNKDKSDNMISKNNITNNETTNKGIELWLGNYGFYEFIYPDKNMLYDINIYEENSEYYAKISIDGWMTSRRLQAKVIGDESEISLAFDKYLEDNDYELYKKGDVLLKFKKEGDIIYTYWDELKPMLEENEKSGKVYFEKE